MAQRGGKRPGAGRKRGIVHVLSARPDSPIRIAEKKLADHLPELVDEAIRIALTGDRAMVAYCIDRVLGKTMQPIDHSGEIDHKVTEVETIRRAWGLVS